MIPPPATLPHDDDALVHTALLYRRPEQLRAAVQECLADAERAAEPVLVALPAHHLEELADVLAGARRMQVRNMSREGRNPARIISTLLDWAATEGPGRVISESVWAQRTYAEVAECLRHEALLNHALAGLPLNILCPFDVDRLDPEVIAGAELTHPYVIDEAGRRPSAGFGDPLEVARGDHWPQTEPAPPISEISFDGDLRSLRHALADDPLLFELAPDRREDLVFAVNEVVTNALTHADGQVRARFWRDPDGVVGEVCTASELDDPLVGRRTPDPGDVGGRGLWLVNQMCDLVEVRDGAGRTSVRMHVCV